MYLGSDRLIGAGPEKVGQSYEVKRPAGCVGHLWSAGNFTLVPQDLNPNIFPSRSLSQSISRY